MCHVWGQCVLNPIISHLKLSQVVSHASNWVSSSSHNPLNQSLHPEMIRTNYKFSFWVQRSVSQDFYKLVLKHLQMEWGPAVAIWQIFLFCSYVWLWQCLQVFQWTFWMAHTTSVTVLPVHELLWFFWNLYQVVQLQFVGLQEKGSLSFQWSKSEGWEKNWNCFFGVQ